MASASAPWATDPACVPYGQAPREMRPNWNLMGSRRRVDPPAGQISNILANQPICKVQDSRDLFSYLSHHGERSNEPVAICDHSRKHFDWQPCEPTDWRIKPRRPRPVPAEHGQGKRMCAPPRPSIPPIAKRCHTSAYSRTRATRRKRSSSHDGSGLQKSRTRQRRRKALGTSSPSSTTTSSYKNYPDCDPATGKLIDYCLRENGGPFGRRKLHQNQPLPVAPVASVAPIAPRPITPVQNWHPFTDVKPAPPNQKLKARLEQSALVAASMMAASSKDSGSASAAATAQGGGGCSRPDSVPKFTSQLFSQRGRSDGGTVGGDSTRSAPVFNPKIHMQFNDSNKAPAKVMPELVPSTNWNFLGGYRPPNRKK